MRASKRMVEEGAKGISDDGMPVMNSYLMRKAMDYAKAFDVPVISHAEDAILVSRRFFFGMRDS